MVMLFHDFISVCDCIFLYNTIFFLLQSQTDRCEGDMNKHNSITITNIQLPCRTVLWDSTVTSDYR